MQMMRAGTRVRVDVPGVNGTVIGFGAITRPGSAAAYPAYLVTLDRDLGRWLPSEDAPDRIWVRTIVVEAHACLELEDQTPDPYL